MFHDRDFIRFGKVIDKDVKKKAVELRLGKRVGALHFNWILGSEDEKGLRQSVASPGGRHLVLLHGLEKGRLRFRRRTVYFIRQKQIGENRTF